MIYHGRCPWLPTYNPAGVRRKGLGAIWCFGVLVAKKSFKSVASF